MTKELLKSVWEFNSFKMFKFIDNRSVQKLINPLTNYSKRSKTKRT